MAFVIEKIPEDKKKKYGLELDNTWSIDHDRSAILIHTGGLPEAKFYSLYWKDRYVDISVGYSYNQLNRGGTGKPMMYDMDLTFYTVDIPTSLKEDKDNILSMISEALTVYGFAGDPSIVRNITFKNLDDSVIKLSEQTAYEKKLQRKQLSR